MFKECFRNDSLKNAIPFQKAFGFQFKYYWPWTHKEVPDLVFKFLSQIFHCCKTCQQKVKPVMYAIITKFILLNINRYWWRLSSSIKLKSKLILVCSNVLWGKYAGVESFIRINVSIWEWKVKYPSRKRLLPLVLSLF